MRRAAWIALSIGIAFQCIGLFALIELKLQWMMFSLIPIPLVLTGYYMGLQGKGYRPYKMPAFYGMALTVIIPYIGSVAIARKLFFTPRQGETPDKKSWQVTLWALGMFLAILLAIALLGLPPTLSYKMKGAVIQHVRIAQESITQARQLQEDDRSFAGMLAAAQQELDAAKQFTERSSSLSGYMGGRIACLSGEIHRLRREWDEAERDYMSALSASAPDREDVEAQAKQGLAEVKAAREKNLR